MASAAGLALPAGIARATGPIALPQGPMIFRKRIERSLRDGERLIVTRSWKVEFARSGQGISIIGEQIAAAVDAPPMLARLAQIEESRSTDAMWPVLLAESGQIMAAGQGTTENDLDRAIAVASDMIARRPLPTSQREAQLRSLSNFDKAGTELTQTMPADLFYPSARPVHLVRSLDLPGGMTGEYEVTYTSRACADSGWLERAERQVVTRINDSEKRASEEWVLQPA